MIINFPRYNNRALKKVARLLSNFAEVAYVDSDDFGLRLGPHAWNRLPQ